MLHMINQKNWVKLHKIELANSIITKSGAIPDGNPTAIFMAGLPGAGKTEFSKALLYLLDSKAVRLDMDEIASQIKGYKPEKADLFRGGASELLSKTLDLTLHKKLDFIMDGTFSSKNAIKNVQRALDHGYKVKIVYIYQDPKLAWDFTEKREQIEHRAINKEGFIDAYFNTITNLKNIPNAIALDIIIKDKYNKINKWIIGIDSKEIDKIITIHYNKNTLRSYLNG